MFWLVRYGEIATKGDHVRKRFEKTLLNNIKATLSGVDFSIKNSRGRIVIETDENIKDQLSHVFGIVSFSRANKVDIETIEDIKPHLNLDFKGTFAVRVKRTDFPGKSTDIERELGSYIAETTGANVDLTNPNKTFNIEIRNNKAYIFDDSVKGLGGLPVGTAGRVYSSLETEENVKAALMMMKRGCTIATDGDASGIEEYHKGQRITETGWTAKISTEKLEDIKKGDDLVFWPLIGNN